MKTSELIKLLKQAGCYDTKKGKKHAKWYSPITGRKFSVPRHSSKEINPTTADDILKQAGLK